MEQNSNKANLSCENHHKNSLIEALVSGTISSTVTTIIYQPLDLLKTRIQLKQAEKFQCDTRLFGRLTKSTLFIVKSDGIRQLWRGTGASLMRSGPGVGLYYALLDILQTNFSGQNHKPDSATQAFYFGLTARSLVSFILLPITVVKVRYESGYFQYPSLSAAIRSAYLNSNGWVGIMPTILRDSLFSGTYYMCYTRFKSESEIGYEKVIANGDKYKHFRNFLCGIASGLIASIITNPIDVIKTNVQVAGRQNGQQAVSTLQITKSILAGRYERLFDGIVPRSLRRTLIAATTWTFYELIKDSFKQHKLNSTL